MEIPKYKDKRPSSDKVKFDFKWLEAENGLPYEAVEYAEHFGCYLAAPMEPDFTKSDRNKTMTTSQLRNFFDTVKTLETEMKDERKKAGIQSKFILLKPKLAYATARVLKEKRESRIKDFNTLFAGIISHAVKKNDAVAYRNFIDFFEATVAYHKYNGGD